MGAEQAEGPRKRRLYRSSQSKLIDGVCGGVAEFLDIDATLVRLAWVILIFIGAWIMIPAYIAGMIIMPRDRDLSSEERPEHPPGRSRRGNAALVAIVGALLVLWGIAMLLHNFHFISWPFWRLWRFWDWDRDVVWGVLLILLGGLLVVSGRNSERPRTSEGSGEHRPRKELIRCTEDKMIGGVCSGLARYFDIDPSLIRLGWVLGTMVSAIIGGILLYVLLWIVLPEEPRPIQAALSSEGEVERSEDA